MSNRRKLQRPLPEKKMQLKKGEGDDPLIFLPARTVKYIRQLQNDPTRKNHDKINSYNCGKCGANFVTVDIHDGVTPFIIACRAELNGVPCTGLARSAFYPSKERREELGEPQWEWYRPSSVEPLSQREKEHVMDGGLLLRPIKGSDEHPK